MKKFLSLALVLVLVLSMAVTASATTTTFDNRVAGTAAEPPYSDSADVTITVSATVEPVYYITVDWEPLAFAYTFGDREWKPESHEYANNGAGWDKTEIANAVEVTNHSNANVSVTFAQVKDSAYTGNVAVAVTNTNANLLTRADEIADSAGKGLASCDCMSAFTGVTVSGTPDPDLIGSSTVVAQVNVTINKA